MATTGYLIDTNASIDYLGEVMPSKGMSFMDQVIDKKYNISVITRIELYAYSKLADDDRKTLDIFTSQADMLNIDDNIIEQTISIRKKYKTKLPDAIIAATALVHELALITRNTKDFDKIDRIELINPYENS
jgi:predicted nucleic acid-binding protein